MKIAIIGKEGRVFPQCVEIAQVAVVDIDPVSQSVELTAFLTPPPPAPGALAEWLCQQEVEVVLAGGIGQRDHDLLVEQGIRVVVGVPPFRVEPVIANFLAGTLQTGANACEQPVEARE